ncbi:hypothetical protein [Stutzerimonas kirkiae]|uniref:hypothetical protein n=1 Tax=Stutzerimonas kirkiae TaxID=2211392 RepID=UPI0010383EDE|nr:hypothetical protein [Stutzerimonas kirkiae]TBV11178.1 hypothetical protein DNK08_04410 [Stutzerimonas kirkiae]TBV14670.1 hypothetical protein DNK01_08920 [Stutzerimonas kirkiae]
MSTTGRAGYLVLALVLAACSLLAITLFNVYVNARGMYQEPPVDAPLPLTGSRPGLDFSLEERVILQRIGEGRASALLIGTSHVMRGFDTCRHPAVLKTAMSGLGPNRALLFARAAMAQGQYQTLFIEITGKDDSRQVAPSEQAWVRHTSLRRFWRSLTVLRTSQSLLACQGNTDSGNAPGFRGVRDIDRLRYSQYQDGLANAPAIARTLDMIEAALPDNGERVVFFFAPVHPDLFSMDDADRLMEAVERLRQHRRFPLESYTSVYRREDLLDDALWVDATHFRPAVGGRFLEHLLGRYAPAHERTLQVPASGQ